jgi:hypothetical protein
LPGNEPEMAVALGGFCLSGHARHRRGAWWHDDCGVGITVDGGAIDAVLVEAPSPVDEATGPAS